jgi:phosphoribosylanthranilate isomerase
VTVEAKICGVRTPAILEAAISAGAEFVGLVFFPKSPRNLTIPDAVDLAGAVGGRARTVAVVVDPDDDLVDRIVANVRPDVLQLHGAETPERVGAIKTRAGLTVFKAVPVSDAWEVAAAARYSAVADRILFDTKAPPGSELPGGNGLSFDWAILEAAAAPFALSGGLDADNVAEAIRQSGAALVDVSSGVETAPGEKDSVLINQFVHAVREAAPKQKKAS